MKAFFADIKETGLVHDRGENSFGTKLALPTEEQTARLNQLKAQIEEATSALNARASELAAGRAEWEKRLLAQYESGKLAWKFQRPFEASTAQGAKLTIAGDEPIDQNFYVGGSLVSERKPNPGLVIASGPNPDNETYTVRFKPGAGAWTAIGLEVLQDEGLPGSRVARGSDRFVVSELEAELSPGPGKPSRKLPLLLATSERFGELLQNEAMAAIDGDPQTGWAFSYGESRNPFLGVRFGEPIQTGATSILTVHLRQESTLRKATIGRFRVALSTGEYSWPQVGDAVAKQKALKNSVTSLLTVDVEHGLPKKVLEALKVPEAQRDEAQQKIVLDHFEWANPELQPLTVRLANLKFDRSILESGITQVVVTESTTPRETRILPRGDFLNATGEIVQPAIPGFLGKLESNGRATRLDLANWIVSPSNPLTARVFVNRLWREFFGTGLSKVLEDLGSQGEWPSHPELLDWLACRRIQAGLGRQTYHSNHRDQPNLSSVVSQQPSGGRARSGEPPPGASKPLPGGSRGGSRHHPGGLRAVDGTVRRPQCEPL